LAPFDIGFIEITDAYPRRQVALSAAGAIDNGAGRDPVQPAAERVVADGSRADRFQAALEGDGGDLLGRGPVVDPACHESVHAGQVEVVELAECLRIRARPDHQPTLALKIQPAARSFVRHSEADSTGSGFKEPSTSGTVVARTRSGSGPDPAAGTPRPGRRHAQTRPPARPDPAAGTPRPG